MTVTFSIAEVRSPHAWASQIKWSSEHYDFNLSEDSGYALLQAIIADSTGDLEPDAPGLWRTGNRFHDMLCQFSRSDTAGITCPAEWVRFLLMDFGVSGLDIDDDSFDAASAAYATRGVTFNGAFFRKNSRERWIQNLLVQTDSHIRLTEKVELHPFSADPVETFDNVLSMSFRPARITQSKNDSGRVHWPDAMDKPMDQLSGKKIVPVHPGGTTDAPSSSILHARFLVGQSKASQTAGMLHFQKRFAQKNRVSFRVAYPDIAARATIGPGQVVTVNAPHYGGSRNIIITEIRFGREMDVEITGAELAHLDDWDSLADPGEVPVTHDPAEEALPAEPGVDFGDKYTYFDNSYTNIDYRTVIHDKDAIKNFEAATGGLCRIIIDDHGLANYMRVIGRIKAPDSNTNHPAFLIDQGEDFPDGVAVEILVGMFLSSWPDAPSSGAVVPGPSAPTPVPVCWPNARPIHNVKFDDAMEYCQNKGAGWHLMTNWEWSVLAHIVMEQGFQPRGNTNSLFSHERQYESAVGRGCGGEPEPGQAHVLSDRSIVGTGPVTWRHDGSTAGISDLVGNLWEWVDGLRLEAGQVRMPIKNDWRNPPEEWSGEYDIALESTSPWKAVELENPDNMLKWALVAPYPVPEGEDDTINPDGDLIIEKGTDVGEVAVACRGGDYASGAAAGMGSLRFAYAPGDSVGQVGFRLAYIRWVCPYGEEPPE